VGGAADGQRPRCCRGQTARRPAGITRLAPGSVELVYRWVATIFKAAVGGRLIAASPCIRIALPKKLDTQ